MTKYFLLLIISVTLLITRVFSTQIQGGLRFSGNEKLVVRRNSIFRKLLLKKNNQDYPLKIYKVIPWAINFVLFIVVIFIYAMHAIFYNNQIGLMFGHFLESTMIRIFGLIWWLLNSIYIGIVNAL